MSTEQLSLNLEIKHDASLSDFSGPGWTPIIDAVRQLHMGMIYQLYLFGQPATGKSHLLSAICESFLDMGKSAICLSFAELVHTDTHVLMSLETFDVIAIDDLDAIARHPDWQEALFHLINRSREQQKQLLFVATQPASRLHFRLPDLTSRLTQAPAFRVPDGRDLADRQALLDSILRRRGWQFDERIIAHLLQEGPHRIGSMMRVLNFIQPLFSHLGRVNVPKSIIQQAIDTIDEQTLLAELEDIHEETQADEQLHYDQRNMTFNF